MRSLIMVSVRSLMAGVVDALRGLVGLSPHYMPVFGAPGTVAGFTDPEWNRHLALFTQAGNTWRNEFAPRFLFGTPKYAVGTAERIRTPLLICVAEQDTEADPLLAANIARLAPKGELKTYPTKHFDVYFGEVRERMIADQVDFFRRHLSNRESATKTSNGA